MVTPEIDVVTPWSTWKTRLCPPPLIVTPPAGPVIVSVPVVSLSSSWPEVRVIVCGVANAVGSKVIVWASPTALASRIAWRSEPGPLSSVLLTTKVERAITVKVSARLVTPASDAVIALVPGVRALATPVPLIVATVGVADAQVTELVMFWVEPSEKVPVAVNCLATPSASSGLPGETAIDTSTTAALVRRNEAAPATPLAVAETV
jgi:hypothetical protein